MVIAKEKRLDSSLPQENVEGRSHQDGEIAAAAPARSTRGNVEGASSRRLSPDLGERSPLEPLSLHPDQTEEHGAVERWMRRNWIALSVTSLLSTAGIALALLPLVGGPLEPLWPWAPTLLSLVAAVPLALAVLILSLSHRQIRLSARRRNLDETSRAHMRSLAAQTAAMQREMQELETQIEARRQVERTLQAVADTLRTQVEEEKRQAQRQSRHLQAVRRAAEMQNTRLRELNTLAQAFVNHVSHEFRTPITVIREYAHTLNDGLLGAINPQQQGCLATIMARVDDLLVMVNDLEDISRLEANVLFAARRRCRVAEILERAMPVLERKAAASRVRLALHEGSNLPVLFCDVEKAARALVNLGVNAIKYSEEGQDVEISCHYEGGTAEATFLVRDQGPGIPPDQVERIFRSFEQLDTSTRSSTKGFGLGLTIVRELVRLNFGQVHVQSTLGRGSTFTFTLPVAAPRLLLPLYAQRAQQIRAAAHHVSILSATSGEDATPEALREVERFLQKTTRRTDLVYAAGEGRWLILALAEHEDLDRMIHRLARRWTQTDIPPLGVLPLLHWRIAGSFDAQSQLDALVDTFLSLQQSPPPSLPAPSAAPPRAKEKL